MPRPVTRQELLSVSEERYQALFALIDCFDEHEIYHGQIPFEDRDKNLRDILVHLHHWHLMFMTWYKVGMSGRKPVMPAEGYTWKSLPALNAEIWQRYQNTAYDEACRCLDQSYHAVRQIIEQHSDEELFTKKKYKWTGSTSLGAYLVSATSSHYDWAIKKIKKYKKALDAAR